MKDFSITQATKKNWKKYIKHINGTFMILIMICFIFLTLFANITNMLFKNKIDLFKEDLGKIAFYSWTFDKNLSLSGSGLDIYLKLSGTGLDAYF